MTHVRLDTGTPAHRKIMALSDLAFRVWLGALCRARDVGGDGDLIADDLDVVPKCPPRGRKRTQVVDEIVTQGLWIVTATGWQIHDYGDWQDGQTSVEAKRAAARERMRRLRTGSPPDVRANRSEHDPTCSREHDANVRRTFGERSAPVRTGSGSGSGSGSDLKPLISRPDRSSRAREPGSAAAAPESESAEKPPHSLAAALEIPLAERASLVVAGGVDAQWSEPQSWPETVAVAIRLAELSGTPRPRLGAYHRDAGVRAIVGLFADGWGPDELAEVLPRVVESDWWRRERRGLAALTPEVLRRAQASGGGADAGPRQLDARTKARLELEAEQDRRELAELQREADARGAAGGTRDLAAIVRGIG